MLVLLPRLLFAVFTGICVMLVAAWSGHGGWGILAAFWIGSNAVFFLFYGWDWVIQPRSRSRTSARGKRS